MVDNMENGVPLQQPQVAAVDSLKAAKLAEVFAQSDNNPLDNSDNKLNLNVSHFHEFSTPDVRATWVSSGGVKNRLWTWS